MTQHCAFVDPSSLSLPSSSLKRPPSPAPSTDDSSPRPIDESPRKRPRSAVTPEERKEARAHRNRIAAQNSRDRRKAQFTYLERRVAELEEENRRLRAGIHINPSPAISTVPQPDVTTVEHEQDQLRKREDERRERENQELRERIRTLEKGYEAVLRALASHSNLPVTSGTLPMTSPNPIIPSHPHPPLQPTSNTEPSNTSSPSSPRAASSPSASILPVSPSSSNSTLIDSPLLFTSGDSFEFPQSPLQTSNTSLALPTDTGGEHCRSFNSVPAAGGRCTSGDGNGEHTKMSGCDAIESEDETASDAAITRLFAEILASPPLGTGILPSSSTSTEDAFSEEVLTKSETKPSDDVLGLGISTSGIGTVDWVEQVHAEMEMEKLLEMLPNVQDVVLDAAPHSDVTLDADMDFSSALAWDGVSVF